MNLQKSITIATITIALLLVGCRSQQNITPTSTNELAENYNGYPIVLPTTDKTVGYPIEEYIPIVVPEVTPNATSGVVRGAILYQGKPVVGYNVYLADIVIDDQGRETTAVLRRAESPQALLGIGGEFVFSDVVPDRYALMFFNGTGAFLLLDPGGVTEQAIIVEVVPGEIVDLGEL